MNIDIEGHELEVINQWILKFDIKWYVEILDYNRAQKTKEKINISKKGYFQKKSKLIIFFKNNKTNQLWF